MPLGSPEARYKKGLTDFRLKILDEDIDLSCIPNGDVNQVDDEEPTIAEIIDERPEEVKIREAYANSKLWKTIKG